MATLLFYGECTPAVGNLVTISTDPPTTPPPPPIPPDDDDADKTPTDSVPPRLDIDYAAVFEDSDTGESSPPTDIHPTPQQVVATCHLATPLNTNETPMELKIEGVHVQPGWMAYTNLYLTSSYQNETKTVWLPPLYKASNLYRILNFTLQRAYGTNNPHVKVAPAPPGYPLSSFEFRVGSKVTVQLSESLASLFGLANGYINNQTKNQLPIQIRVDYHPETEIFALQSDQITATYQQNQRRERYCSILNITMPTNANESIELQGSNEWVPLDATLHLDRIHLYLSRLTHPGQPIYTTSFKLFIIGLLRPLQQQQHQQQH
jgi:hypothetical protein